MDKEKNIQKIISIARRYGAKKLILFGSAKDNIENARDIDLACEGVVGWKLYELAAKLETELGVPFDVVSLSPSTRFTRHIEQQGRAIM